MAQTWFPQRNQFDAPVALMKSFISILNYPISKFTVETDVMKCEDFLNISLGTYMKLFEKWGIEYAAFRCPFDKLPEISSPSILFVKAGENSEQNDFVIFDSVKDGYVKYLQVERGWNQIPVNEFEKIFNGVVLSAKRLKFAENDFQKLEQIYEAKRLGNPHLTENVKVIDEFLSDKECEYMINLAMPHFRRSEFMIGDKRKVHDGRTSKSAELHNLDNDPVIKTIKQRASELIKIPVECFESLQCVSYEPRQFIEAHFDTFDDTSEGGKKIIAEGGQRKYTLLAYLNDDFEGGETFFPLLDYMVTPKKGSLLIFNNLNKDSTRMSYSFHSGMSVAKGRKFAINIWVRDNPLPQGSI